MKRQSNSIEDKAISIRDAIYLGTLLLSMGTIYGITNNRMANVESAQTQINMRYEREVVPRSEHLQMNAVLEQRLQSIIESQKKSDEQLQQMQLKLDQLILKKE